MSEQSEFLKDLDTHTEDSFEKPLIENVEKQEEEDTEFKAKNRRERRLMAENTRLREEAIAASARAQTLAEIGKSQEGADPLKKVRAIYGDDTPEKKIASDIMENTLREIEERAVQRAVEKFEGSRDEESKAVRQEEDTLDDILANVEDEYGIDDSDRKGYLTLLEKISPKDRDGNIIEYADPDYVAETYLKLKEKSSSRAKDLASRGMTRSGSSQPSDLERSQVEKELKALGII